MSVLLRQPHGFEGFAPVQEVLDPDDLASTEGDEHESRDVSLEPTCPSLLVLDDVSKNRVANRLQVLGLDSESLPLLEESVHELPDFLGANEHSELGEVRRGDKHDVPVKTVGADAKISVRPAFEHLPHDLHVLLRHRPRSIATQESA